MHISHEIVLFYFFFLDQNDYWEMFTVSCNLTIKRDLKGDGKGEVTQERRG